jgi:ABC-type hemin transport system ATPase subunit
MNSEEHLAAPEISPIIGPRQSGKTTLLKLLQEELVSLGHKILFLNPDVERDVQYASTQEQWVRKIQLEFGDESGYDVKDIAQFLQLERTAGYTKTIKLLVAQCGNLLNQAELVALSGLS